MGVRSRTEENVIGRTEQEFFQQESDDEITETDLFEPIHVPQVVVKEDPSPTTVETVKRTLTSEQT